MMNNKRSYPMPQQQQPQYRHYPPQGVPPQGPPAGAAPRNPNAIPNMRVQQNGPQRQPQPQPQVHSGQPHGITGVSVQHQQHPQQPQAQQHHPQQQQQQQHHQQQQQQQQQQHTQQQQQMYGYPGHNQLIYPQPYPYVQTAQSHAFMQQSYPTIRIVANPQFYALNPQAQTMHYAAPPNQQVMAQHQHQQPPHGYFTHGYVPHPTRLPVHHTGQPVQGVQHVPSVQVPQVHPNAAHQVQHSSQHNHPHSQAAQPSNTQGQVTNRGEGAPAPVQEKKREKKILKIVDPTTGEVVIGDTSNSNPTPVTEPTQRSGTPVEGNGDVPASVNDSQEPSQTQTDLTETSSNVEETVPKQSITKVDKVGTDDAVSDAVSDSNSKSKTARAEFYQKITQASDEGGRAPSSTPSISQTASVNPPSPTPASEPPEQPESPPLDTSKSQLAAVAVTPAAVNTSSDDFKNASLEAVSPIPLENYLTPRKSSSPSTNEESFQEEDIKSNDITLPEPDEEEKDEIVSVPVNEEEEVQATTPEPEILNVEKADSGCPESIDKDEVDDEIQSGNEKTESVCDEGSSEEQASSVHQNGDLGLEEGELAPEDEESSTAVESGTEADDGESSETSDKGKKKEKIKYDRNFLLSIGDRVQPSKMLDLFPDVAKDQMRSHHGQQMNKSPGGSRDQFSGRMGRGGPGQGQKPSLMMGGMGYGGPRGNEHNMMRWGIQPMMVPPAPPRGPPKVLEITREEVKLHKAKDAWKPAVKHRGGGGGGGGGNDQPKDPEENITDDIVKKTRGILNKLTPENFEKLVGKFMNLPLEDKEERISKVIKVVFEKAVDEPSFSKEYAKMVHTVCNASQETSKKFRKLILDQCQQEFQKSNIDEDKIKLVEQQLEEAKDDEKEKIKAELEDMKFQMRRRSLGNVRFIGELYKLQMLTPKIMVECVNMLLASPDEENLECLCKLLTTVGQKLDEQLHDLEQRVMQLKNQPDSPRMPKFIPDDKWMTKTFNKLLTLSENKKLSSRIRFALLDAFELRENNWKPRRDSNAPKTIDEVRRDAYRQEMEEKRQINSLPPPDQRGGSSRQPPGPQQAKKGDWNTVQASNKSSRFQMKKPGDSQGISPVLAPPSQTWGRNNPVSSSGSLPQSTKLPIVTAPRFMNRFHGLADERLNNSSSNQPSFRDSMPQQQQYIPASSTLRRISPAPSSTSSRENSRPVSPKDSYIAMSDEGCTADINETVKNIFEEYLSVGKFDDTLHWIRQRFPGEKISDFVDELSRQVAELPKLEQQQKAGTLTRLLLKANTISKELVLKTIANGVIADLPDIEIDSPMAASYLAQFLIEIFVDELNFDWLIAVGENLSSDETWETLVLKTLNLLKSKSNEEVVQSLYSQTKENSRIPTNEIPWLCTAESIAQKMVPVLKENLLSSEEEVRQLLKENSWDLREELTSRSLIEAICLLTWKRESFSWDTDMLNKLLPLLPLKLFPIIWKQATEFITRENIDKAQTEELWGVMYQLNLTTTLEPTNE